MCSSFFIILQIIICNTDSSYANVDAQYQKLDWKFTPIIFPFDELAYPYIYVGIAFIVWIVKNKLKLQWVSSVYLESLIILNS